MSGAITGVLYELKVTPKTEAADAALASLDKKLHSIGGDQIAIPPIKVPPIVVPPIVVPPVQIPPIKIETGAIAQLEANLKTLEEQKKKAFTVAEAASFEQEIRHVKEEMDHFNASVGKAASAGQGMFGRLKEKVHEEFGGGNGGGILSSVVGGAAGGVALGVATEGFHFLAEKAKESHDATVQVSAALAKAGLTGAEAAEEMKRVGEASARIGDDFALPGLQVKSLMGTIAAFSGQTGKELDHLTEVSLGAAKATGLSAEAVARAVSKASDPESAATLSRLGVSFDKNATAAEKLEIINRKLGPAIQGVKDANNDAYGTFEKVKNKLEEAVVQVGSSLFEILGPAFQLIGAGLSVVEPVLETFSHGVAALSGFVKDNAVYFGVLGATVGLYAVITNAAAIGTAVLTVAKSAGAIATQGLAFAQGALNVVMNANPIAIVVLALGALVAGAIYAYKHFEGFRNVIDQVWKAIKTAGEAVYTGIKFWAEWLNPVGLLIKGFQYLYEKIGFVKTAVDAVVNTVKNAGSAILSLLGITNEETSATEKSTAALKEKKQSLEDAKAATDAFAASIIASNKAASDEAKQQTDNDIALIRNIDKQLANSALPEAIKAQLKNQRASLVAHAKEQVGIYEDDAANQKKIAIEVGAATADETKKAAKEGLSAFQKATAELALLQKKREEDTLRAATALQEKANAQYLAGVRKTADLTKDEEKVIAQRRLDDKIAAEQFIISKIAKLNENADVIGLQVGSKKGDVEKDTQSIAGTLATIKDNIAKDQLNIIKMKIGLDAAALDALEVAEIALAKKEIEIGVRPKSDIVPLLKEQIINAQRSLAADQVQFDVLNLNPDANAAAITALQTKMLQTKTTVIGLQDEIKKFNDGIITALSAEVKAERELQKKNDEERLASARSVTDKLIDISAAAFAKQKSLSREELDDKKLTFDKERDALAKSYRKGEISSREYNTKLALLTKNRTDFEAAQNSASSSVFSRLAKSGYEEASAAGQKFLIDYLRQKAAELLVTLTTEETKTAGTVAGSAARIAPTIAEQAATLALAAAKGVAAAAAAVYNAIASLPFPLDIIAGAASAASVVALVGGLTGAIKFEKGGLGLVGEKGPEIIGPTKDFSQFATQLVLSTAKEVRQAMDGGSSGGGRSSGRQSPIPLVIKPFGIPGRDLTFAIQKDKLIKQTERVAIKN